VFVFYIYIKFAENYTRRQSLLIMSSNPNKRSSK